MADSCDRELRQTPPAKTGADSKGVSAPGVEFVPMIWGAADADPATTARASAAGRTLLRFNEPDLAGDAYRAAAQGMHWPSGRFRR